MKVLYFAWLRERIGAGEETVSPPEDVATVGALLRWLAARSEEHAAAFADPSVVRAAVNREHATPDTSVSPDDEVAFFPPVTGG
jgi:sulfur-carrier protein